jgi:hypothetical protein
MKWIRKYKNPDENPDLPTNFKNLEKKISKPEVDSCCQMFVISKKFESKTLGKKFEG